jgi:ABC-type Fe3+-siderophore transport system permease subunit
MARKQSNILAVLTWFIGLLGCIGFIYTLGFIALIIPLLFWIFGSKFTKIHCSAYFNGLITGIIIYICGLVINRVLIWLDIKLFNFTLVGLIYFALICIFGLINALNHKRYKPELVIGIF